MSKNLFGEDVPDTAEAALAHYGKKGMRWGVRNDDAPSGSSPKPVKTKVTSQAIQGARARQQSRAMQLNNQIAKTNLSSGKQLDKNAKTLADMHSDFLNSPDRATALRLTTGEKLAFGLLAVAVPAIGTGVAGGAIGARVAVRKSVERQQRKSSS